jgi:SH3 domain protein
VPDSRAIPSWSPVFYDGASFFPEHRFGLSPIGELRRSLTDFRYSQRLPTGSGCMAAFEAVESEQQEWLMRKWLLALSLGCLCLAAQAQTAYISDELTVPLRRGPSNGHKIINAALPSGTQLTILGEDQAAGFTQVRTPNGSEGWVPTQYLTSQPIARDRLVAATRRVEALEAQLKSLRENYQDVRGASKESEGRATDLGKQNEKLQAELAEIRRVSATSIANYEENKKLKTDNQTLQTQVAQLSERVKSLERNVTLKWLLAGGALVLLGLVLGAWIKSRPKRSTWA